MTEHDLLESRVRSGLAVLADAVPIPSPAGVPRLAPAPSRHRGGWFVPAAVGACVVLVVLGVVLLNGGPWRTTVAPADPRRPATVPRVFGGDNLLTASVQRAPAGRAAVVISEEFDEYLFMESAQTLVVGADSNSYRTLGSNDYSGELYFSAQLSWDGRWVAAGLQDGDIRLLDLETGDERRIRVPGGDGMTGILAAAPDWRHLVAGVWVQDPNGGSPTLRPYLLDLRTGDAMPLFDDTVKAAAFSPDGTRIAVQAVGRIYVVNLAGRQLSSIATGSADLAGDGAWSPDGRFLVTVERSSDNEWPWPPDTVRFVPVDPATPKAEIPPTLRAHVRNVVGWRSTDELVLGEHRPDNALIVRDVRTGKSRVLAAMPFIGGVDSAALGLLPDLTTRPVGGEDRGPWPMWFVVPLVVVGSVVAAVVAGIVWLARRRRRLRLDRAP